MPSDTRIRLVSFGFKYPPYPDTSVVVDVRRLNNPYREKLLRPLSGMSTEVQRFVRDDRSLPDLLKELETHLKNGVTDLAVGCYGGHHRSVAVVEFLAERILASGQSVRVEHRELAITWEKPL